MVETPTRGPRRRNSVLESLEIFRAVCPEISMGAIVAFLYICENEGLNVRELAEICQVTDGTASRAVRALAEADEPGALPPYFGLLRLAPDPRDARGRLIRLTERGRALRDRVNGVIADAIRTDGTRA